MKTSGLLLVIVLTSVIMACGKKSSDSGNRIQREEKPNTEEGQPGSTSSRYSTVQLGSSGYVDEFEHLIRLNLDEAPSSITGNFKAEDSNCSFHMKVSAEQANKLRELSDDLRICTYREDTGIIIEADAITLCWIKKQAERFPVIKIF
ncbi:MAG: hypothetical protein H0V66_12950 [Bdellovibrionales bacterium]|nr:hypothetical protein [Bdellovibrionales bacterium]